MGCGCRRTGVYSNDPPAGRPVQTCGGFRLSDKGAVSLFVCKAPQAALDSGSAPPATTQQTDKMAVPLARESQHTYAENNTTRDKQKPGRVNFSPLRAA